MLCPYCGARIDPRSPVCPNCHRPLVPGLPQTSVPQPVPPTPHDPWNASSPGIQASSLVPLDPAQPPRQGPPSRPQNQQLPPWDPQSPFYSGPRQPGQTGSGFLNAPLQGDPYSASLQRPGVPAPSGQLPQGGASGQWDLGGPSSALVPMRIPGTPSRPTPHMPGLGEGSTLRNGSIYTIMPYVARRLAQRDLRFAPWVAMNRQNTGEQIVIQELPLTGMTPFQAATTRQNVATQLKLMSQNRHLLQCLGQFEENNRHFLVFEYRRGAWLSDLYTERGTFSERDMLDYGLQVLDALHFLEHLSPPAIHGQISPDTLLLEEGTRQVVLAGWHPGLVALLHNIPWPTSDVPSNNYTSPLMQQGKISSRVDIYSLGATLYYLVTGLENTAGSAGLYPPARTRNPALSASAEEMLAKSVRYLTNQGYQNVVDMEHDLERVQRNEPLTTRRRSVDPSLNSRSSFAVIASTLGTLLLITALIIGLIVRSRGSDATSVNVPTPIPTPTVNPTAIALAAKQQGISAGQFIFDTAALGDKQPVNGTPVATSFDKTAKTAEGAVLAELDGAAAFRAGNYTDAVTNFQLAIADDPSNAEARIYLANAQILATKTKNYVTIAVAADFASNDIDVSREILRGAAQAQDTLNNSQSLPNNGKIVVAIGSVGADASAAPVVGQFLAQEVAQGNPNHVVGVVTWSPRDITADMLKTIGDGIAQLATQQIPLIAPIRTTDQIPSNPDFFYLSIKNTEQAKTQANLIIDTYNSSRVVVGFDKDSIRNAEAAQTAIAVLQQRLGKSNVIPVPLDKTATPSYSKIVGAVPFYGADGMLYFGNESEVAGIAVGLYKQGYSIPILASPSADSPTLIGQGSNNTAKLALTNQKALSNVHVLTLADGGAWSFVKASQPTFFNRFTTTFSTTQQIAVPSVNAILSYDAVSMIMKGLLTTNAWTSKQLPTPIAARTALAAYTATPYQGVGGSVQFDQDGNAVNHSLVLKDVIISSDTDANGNPLLAWKIRQLIPPDTFCSSSPCTAP